MHLVHGPSLGSGAMLGFHYPPPAATTSCTLVREKDSGHMWQIVGKDPLRCNSRRITPPELLEG